LSPSFLLGRSFIELLVPTVKRHPDQRLYDSLILLFSGVYLFTLRSPPNHFLFFTMHPGIRPRALLFFGCGGTVGTGKIYGAQLLEEVMKNNRFIVTAALSFLVLITPAFAQSGKIKADVPFEFEVGNHTMAAGEYYLTSTTEGFLRIQSIDGPQFAVVLTNYMGGGPFQDKHPRLVFNNYGDHYFLSEVWVGGGSRELFASSRELKLARAKRQTQTVMAATGQLDE
jgi:hypothetical protein